MKRASIGIFFSLLCAFTFAADGRWTEGPGQGNLEYFIDVQGVRLYIGCPTKDGSADLPSSVSLENLSNGAAFKKFKIQVGGMTFDGPFSADSRVGENNFIALLDELRKADAIVNVAGKLIKFPKSNALKVLPSFGKKGFSCNLDQ